MNRLQLATLLSWAGEEGLKGRKRLQKVTYLLKNAGCPIEAHYVLHHYGPYSQNVADVCDQMVAANLLEESLESSGAYKYKLTTLADSHLKKSPASEMSEFQEMGQKLIKEKIWPLELASTILYFYEQEKDWDTALQAACEYKNADINDEVSQKALKLAQHTDKSL